MTNEERVALLFTQKVRVDPNTGCHVWTGMRHNHGYGTFWSGRIGGRRTKGYAHRAAYERAKGAIPAGLQLDHLCRNPPCCNPDHLEPVTPAENVRRGPGSISACRKAGHPFTPENTGHNYAPDGRPRRYCLTCARERQRAARSQ